MLLGVVLRRFLPYILASALVISVLAYVGRNLYNRGYEASEIKWRETIAQERERVRIANDAAREAGRMLAADYLRKVKQRDETISELLEEVGSDPSAGNIAIPRSVVRTLNKIR
jgi:hypothetical protein